MSEDDAIAWLDARGWWHGIYGDRIRAFVALAREENERQNLIASSTLGDILSRHVVDSAQLLELVPNNPQSWIDLGSGAGFPGMVIACLRSDVVTLVDERRLRTDFLERTVRDLFLSNVEIVRSRVEKFRSSVQPDVITARAYAPLTRIFETANHLAGEDTVWLLPKGRRCQDEIGEAEKTWSATFHVKQSFTDPAASIIVAQGVHRR